MLTDNVNFMDNELRSIAELAKAVTSGGLTKPIKSRRMR